MFREIPYKGVSLFFYEFILIFMTGIGIPVIIRVRLAETMKRSGRNAL